MSEPERERDERLPHERLEVYGVALEFIEDVEAMLRRLPRRGFKDGDQLDRAATSVLLNIAEGAGEFAPLEKARIYRLALRSAMECGGALDRLRRKYPITPEAHRRAKLFVARLVAMLTKLVLRFGGDAP